MKIEEKHNKKLLVEGNDDQHVVWALCEKFEIPQNFDVVDCENVNKVLVQIPVRFKASGVEAVGIIVDADADLQSRWDSLKGILTKEGFTVPDALPADGLILDNGSGKRVGVWIMPNNNVNGMLEDFMAFLIPADDPLLPIAQQTLTDIETKGLNKYPLIHHSKALIHTWLAWQEAPGKPMGLAITSRYLTTNTSICEKFIEWLKALFS